ncbi:ubiquinol oxidase subunit II [Hydrogenophaga pseudoflava]|uniref:Ubiquinol oxidase subunit 2 n=1 Tax=Hydrogenophaga pseudoflava TaxID=47421 RepID=A0A4P6WV49_HYDPS|nr:ubiquinol oxidase subunit II [Hydrogenophaga pseudoflava]QBM27290.1 Cytochrome bo(3) ubiquinol oxidase subunit 2 precursor [Hydrogenophaga pseudoflava]
MRPTTPLRLAALPLLASLLTGCSKLVVLNPAGDVAAQQGDLVVIATVLMLLIIVPVIALTLWFAWRYRQGSRHAETDYAPDWHHSTKLELVIWAAPLVIIIALGAITWITTHKLDPYRPLDRISEQKALPENVKPLEVQVVSLDWKWLFVLPEQGIATVNELAAPVDRPIRFTLTSSTTMNAFYVPDLAGMIYTMPGMQTELNAVINQPGVFRGMSSHYSGAGFSGMNFRFHGLSEQDFEQWVARAKAEGQPLTRQAYLALAKPSERHPVERFSSVEAGLFDRVVGLCVEEGKTCMHQVMALDASRNRAHRSARALEAAAAQEICSADDTLPTFTARP